MPILPPSVALVGALLLILAFAFFGIAHALERNTALAARIETLERTPHYQGKDADGKEVWSPAVTTVELKH